MEDEGLPTTQISLIRLHTEKTTPPRALWVPFELGRPLGVPNDPEFQSRVLLAALKLLEASSGPVISDFKEEAPLSDREITTLACPVNLNISAAELSDTEKLVQAFKDEIAGLLTWYDIALEKRKRTTVGASKMNPTEIGEFISDFITGKTPDNPREDVALGLSVNLAIDDLRAYYSEAITAQPGQESPASEMINKWFWTETAASKAIYALRDIFRAGDDGFLKIVGNALLIPVEYASR